MKPEVKKLTLTDFFNSGILEKFYSGKDHRIDHVLRVLSNSIKIYHGEIASGYVTTNFRRFHNNEQTKYKISSPCINEENKLMAASLLHDVCRSIEKIDHAEEGAILAREILEFNFGRFFNGNDIGEICEAIRTHRYSKKLKASSFIGAILQDADRLDSIGSLAITRCLEYSFHHNIPIYDPQIKPRDEYISEVGQNTTAINHLIEKNSKIKPESFNTNTAKGIAITDCNFVNLFINTYVSQAKIDIPPEFFK